MKCVSSDSRKNQTSSQNFGLSECRLPAYKLCMDACNERLVARMRSSDAIGHAPRRGTARSKTREVVFAPPLFTLRGRHLETPHVKFC